MDKEQIASRVNSAPELFEQRKNAIRAALLLIQEAVDYNFDIPVEKIHWGHAGDMARVLDSLNNILIFVHK
jgi:hypothetical protein